MKYLFSMLWLALLGYGFWYTYDLLWVESAWKQISLPALNFYNLVLLCLLIVGMFMNWGLEAKKWQLSIRDLEEQQFFHAFKATMAGVAVSTWMPNRIGEYIGKVFFVAKENRLKASISAIYVSFTQLIATLSAGLLGLIYFIFGGNGNIGSTLLWTFIALGLSLLVLVFLSKKWQKPMAWVKAKSIFLHKAIECFYRYPKSVSLKLLLWSYTRLFVFTLQFMLMLELFGGEGLQFSVFLLILLLYAVQSVIPASALTGIGIRGALSVFFLGEAVAVNSGAIISASYALWMLNLVVPSLFGLVFLLLAKESSILLWQQLKQMVPKLIK